MPPNSVSIPVATTSARPRPLATTVAAEDHVARGRRAAAPGRAAARPSSPTATDSPVSADSSTCRPRPRPRARRPGAVSGLDEHEVAGHELPRGDVDAPRRRARPSPWAPPARASASIARSARYSWTKPSSAANEHDHADRRSSRSCGRAPPRGRRRRAGSGSGRCGTGRAAAARPASRPPTRSRSGRAPRGAARPPRARGPLPSDVPSVAATRSTGSVCHARPAAGAWTGRSASS